MIEWRNRIKGRLNNRAPLSILVDIADSINTKIYINLNEQALSVHVYFYFENKTLFFLRYA